MTDAKAGMVELRGDWFAVDRIAHIVVLDGAVRVVLDGCEYLSVVVVDASPEDVLAAMAKAWKQRGGGR